MRSDQNHIIEKVFLEVNTSNMEVAHSIKNNIRSFLERELFPVIEAHLNGYPSSIIHRLDRLEVNLGLDRWNDSKLLQAEIAKALVNSISNNSSISNQASNGFIAKKVGSDSNSMDSKEAGHTSLTGYENNAAVFLFYIKHGYLPWYGDRKHIDAFIHPDSFKAYLKDDTFISKLLFEIDHSTVAFQRLVYQLPSELSISLMSAVSPALNRLYSSLFSSFQRVGAEVRFGIFYLAYVYLHGTSRDKRSEVHRFILTELENIKGEPLTGFLRKFILTIDRADYSISSEDFLQLFRLVLSRGMQGESIDGSGEDSLKDLPSNLQTIAKAILWSNDKFEMNESANNLNESNTNLHNDKSVYSKDIDTIHSKEENFLTDKLDEILVQNAGLVLLYPFLPKFCKELGITSTAGMIFDSRKELAVQILHYLATGTEVFFEGSMVFEKFLCGYPIGMPVRRDSLLSDDIKKESETLLTSVISHWPELKSTSPDGLRQMFIQRNGKLIQSKDNYKLIVERKAQDVLLDKLNWGISIVKIPWVKKLIFVEW